MEIAPTSYLRVNGASIVDGSASNGGGEFYVHTLKSKRARTLPLVPAVVPIVDRWSAGKSGDEWLFAAPAGGPLRERNWQRSVSWREATATIGRPELRIQIYGTPLLRCGCIWRRSESGSAGTGARHGGDDNGPVRAHDRPQSLGRGTARGHHGGTVRRRTGR